MCLSRTTTPKVNAKNKKVKTKNILLKFLFNRQAEFLQLQTLFQRLTCAFYFNSLTVKLIVQWVRTHMTDQYYFQDVDELKRFYWVLYRDIKKRFQKDGPVEVKLTIW